MKHAAPSKGLYGGIIKKATPRLPKKGTTFSNNSRYVISLAAEAPSLQVDDGVPNKSATTKRVLRK